MHIAFLTSEYPHDKVKHAAGIGTSIKNLAAALAKEKISVSIFVYGQNTDEVFIENNIKIHLIKSGKKRFGAWYFYRKQLQNYINKFIVSDIIDVVEAPDWTGITAFMNLKAPLAIRLHGSDAYFCHLENRQQKVKNYWFEKLALSKASAFVSPTDFAGNLTKKIFSIKKEIQTIPNGIDLENFHNSEPQSFEKGLILYIGTIIRKKGVLEFPKIMDEVLAKHPDAKLLLIGSDSFDIKTQSASTWKLIENSLNDKTRGKIEYIGKVPYASVQDYIKKANVCVFPSFAETQGMVTIEAMALQKAVVNSDFGWAQELIVDGESGFLANPSDHFKFSEKIIALLEDSQLCIRIGENASKRAAQKFDIAKIASQNIEFYRTLTPNI